MFARELDGMSPAVRARTLGTLDALSTGTTWDLLRDRHSLSPDEAQRTMVDAIVSHLGPSE